MTTHRKLVARLVGAVAVAFAASMVMTWLLHDKMASREAYALIDSAIRDVEASIREKVDKRMIHQAIVVRDLLADFRKQEWWNDPDESSKRLREIANELGVDEICVADSEGLLTHSARRDEVGALNFVTATGQAHEFAELLGRKTEIVQPLMPNTLRGSMVKYVGVWIPEGGFVQTGCPIAEVITRANEALSQDNGANMFVTVWVGEIDFDTGKVTYVNAGHNQPIVLRPSSEEPVAYITTRPCLVLGAVEGARYRSQELQLAPGEGLYLYTDGITEQHDAHAEMFGEERLLSTVRDTLKSNPEFVTLTSSPIIDTVFAQVTKHSGVTAQSDDRTQLIIRYNGPKPQAG